MVVYTEDEGDVFLQNVCNNLQWLWSNNTKDHNPYFINCSYSIINFMLTDTH